MPLLPHDQVEADLDPQPEVNHNLHMDHYPGGGAVFIGSVHG